MPNIRVDIDYTIKDGTEIKFRSPVDCSQITGLIVYYPGADGNTVSKVFALSDAHGNNVGDIDHLFAEDVVVKVILDVTKSMAFVQNADTNAYLEGKFAEFTSMTLLWENASPDSAFAAQTVSCNWKGYDSVVVVGMGAVSVADAALDKYVYLSKTFVWEAGSSGREFEARVGSLTSDGISFRDAYCSGSNNTTFSVNNLLLVPHRIYGIIAGGASGSVLPAAEGVSF